mmetsp:Transcript_43734/g.72880  ORF Transcript_43734/g.72880 Transcript_43734/m.72880 type:complete len:351 (+) Transcript_43734:34-1086(+)
MRRMMTVKVMMRLTSAKDTSGNEDLDVVGNVRVTEVVVEALWVGLDAAEDLLHREVLHDALHFGVDRGTLDAQLSLLLRDLLVEDEVLDFLKASLELSVTGMSLETLAERVERLVVHLEESEDRSLSAVGLDVVGIEFEALFAVKERGLPSGELGVSGGAVGKEDSVGGITLDSLSVALDGLRELASSKGFVSAVLGFEGESGALVGLILGSLLFLTDSTHQLLDVSVAVLDKRRLKGVDGLVVLSEGTEGVSNANVGLGLELIISSVLTTDFEGFSAFVDRLLVLLEFHVAGSAVSVEGHIGVVEFDGLGKVLDGSLVLLGREGLGSLGLFLKCLLLLVGQLACWFGRR